MLLSGLGSEVKLDASTTPNLWASANDYYERCAQAISFHIHFDNSSSVRGDTSSYRSITFADAVNAFLYDYRYELEDSDPLAVAIKNDLIDFSGQLWRDLSMAAAPSPDIL